VFAIKGGSDPRLAIWPRRPARPKAGRESALFIVGSTAAKEIVVSRLGIETPGPGYCHFPPRDIDYFEQLLAEKPIRRIVNGVHKRVWVKAGNARNEALDCRIYSLCALHALRSYGFDLDREAARVARIVIDPAKPRPPRARMSDFGKLT
jgi:phage terminase large subunit GpA-like protein